jgi:hypothetical protein
MLKAEQIPTEVLAVFEKAGDSGEPWNIADTIAAAINAWPGMYMKAYTEWTEVRLPLPKEQPGDE